MFNGKMKALTFSFDDGVKQDVRLIEILNRYGLKATFNINSGLLGNKHSITTPDWSVDHTEVDECDVREIYRNHEVAVHTLTHPNLTTLSESEIIYQVEQDRLKLSDIVGYEVTGMAYPCGGVNNNDYVADVIKNNTGVKYSRTITTTSDFEIQENLFRFNPSVYYIDIPLMEDLAVRFIEFQPESPKIFYIWGHSYELDIYGKWDVFENFCNMISMKKDIFYGANKEILLNK
ncbi:MAG: polysaccharide deacetylase family protein [Saccharofermentanales bacterium]